MINARPVSKRQAFLHLMQYALLIRKQNPDIQNQQKISLASAFIGRECIVPDEERLVLLKPVVHLSFTYDV